MCVCLVLLAHDTAFDIFMHELCKTRPPEFSDNELVSLQISGMPSSLMVMAAGEDRAAERIIWRDIHMALVGEDMVIEFPVREMRLEGSRDVLQGCL